MPRKTRSVILLCLLFALFLGITPLLAQGIPLAVNQNAQGELTSAAPTNSFVVNIGQPQTAQVQVLGIAPGMIPTFTVTDPSGVTVASVNSGTAIAQSTVAFTGVGSYTILVGSANGSSAAMSSAWSAARPSPRPSRSRLTQVAQGSVSAELPLVSYVFGSSPLEPLILTIQAAPGSPAAPLITIKDGTTDETLRARQPAVRWRELPTAARQRDLRRAAQSQRRQPAGRLQPVRWQPPRRRQRLPIDARRSTGRAAPGTD